MARRSCTESANNDQRAPEKITEHVECEFVKKFVSPQGRETFFSILLLFAIVFVAVFVVVVVVLIVKVAVVQELL